MKKVTLSVIAALAMSTFAVAGGDIAPVEPEVNVPEVVSTPGAFYLGLAYAYMNSDIDATGTATFTPDASTTGPSVADTTASGEADWNAIMLQAGYQFNPYLAIEGRYWTNVGTGDYEGSGTFDGQPTPSYTGDADDIDAWGIYVKPTLPVGESFNVYALLGYGNVSTGSLDDSGFQWGAGASYSISDNLSLFVDYVSLYDDSYNDTFSEVTTNPDGTIVYDDNIDQSVYSVNFGVTYKF